MQHVSESALEAAAQPNSIASIKERASAGSVSWAGPLLLLPMRTFMWMATQGILALVFLAQHRPDPWRQATCWYCVVGTLGDIVCLLLMRHFTHCEGIRLRDLLGPIRMKWGRDLWLGLAMLVLAIPIFAGAGWISQRIFYSSPAANPAIQFLHSRGLPVWAMVYSVGIWWVIQSPTEEATYNGFALPRLVALTGRTWVAVLIVSFWFTVQHCAFGFIPDWRFLAYRFVAFYPACLAASLVYLYFRRLMPLIFAHWPMDIAAVLITAF